LFLMMTSAMPGSLPMTRADSAELRFLRNGMDSNIGPTSLAILACVSPLALETLEFEYGQWASWALKLFGYKQGRLAFVSLDVDDDDEKAPTFSSLIQREINTLADGRSTRLLILFSESFNGHLELPTVFTQCEIIASPEANVCLSGDSTYCGILVSDWILNNQQTQYQNHRFISHNMSSVISSSVNQTHPSGLPNNYLEERENAPSFARIVWNMFRGTAGTSRDLRGLFSRLNIPMPTAALGTIALFVSCIRISDEGIFVGAQLRRTSTFDGNLSKAVSAAKYFISWETILGWFQRAWDILLEFLCAIWTEIKSRIVWFFETLIRMAKKLMGQTKHSVGV